MLANGFLGHELGVLGRLTSREKIQRFLEEDIGYNKEKGGAACRGPRRVLRDRVAHCMEGALFGAAALRVQGWEPLLLDLEAVRDDDHVLAIFQQRGCWGAIAKSNYAGLRFASRSTAPCASWPCRISSTITIREAKKPCAATRAPSTCGASTRSTG